VPMFESVSLSAIPPDASPYPWEFSLEPAHVELSPDQPVATLENFGAFRRGSLSGFQFNDVNGSGAPETGEPGLGGWTIYLDQNGNGQRDRSEQAVTTDGSGQYVFDGLRPGPYALREQPQAGRVPVAPASGSHNVP